MSATAKGGSTPVARSSQDGHLGLSCIFTSPIFGYRYYLNKPFEKSSSLLATKLVAWWPTTSSTWTWTLLSILSVVVPHPEKDELILLDLTNLVVSFSAY